MLVRWCSNGWFFFFVVFCPKENEALLKQHCSLISITSKKLTLQKNAAKQDTSERLCPFPWAEHAYLHTIRFFCCHLNTAGDCGQPALESLSGAMLSVNILRMFPLLTHCWGSPFTPKPFTCCNLSATLKWSRTASLCCKCRMSTKGIRGLDPVSRISLCQPSYTNTQSCTCTGRCRNLIGNRGLFICLLIVSFFPYLLTSFPSPQAVLHVLLSCHQHPCSGQVRGCVVYKRPEEFVSQEAQKCIKRTFTQGQHCKKNLKQNVNAYLWWNPGQVLIVSTTLSYIPAVPYV